MSELSVELKGVTVRYGAVEAVKGVSLGVAKGEVHALVGENGAGKSTLMRALYGLAPMAAGEVWVKGARIARPSPAAALSAGVGMVHQHFMLVETLTVAENVVLGREPGRWGLYDAARAEAEVEELSRRHGLGLTAAGRKIAELSVGERQRVEILKVLARGADVLVLDEPTAVLTPPEVGELLRVLRELGARGATVILVTHKLDEVAAIAERVTVMRRGEVVETVAMRETTPAGIARKMVGRELVGPPAPPTERPGEVLLALEGVSVAGGLEGVSLAVREGEIVGVAGVEGNGQAELSEAIAGLREVSGGRITIAGREVTRAGVAERRAAGLGYVPEDRHRRGLLLEMTVAENLMLGREGRYATAGWLDRGRLAEDAGRAIGRFDVRPADGEAVARGLSGGNQQKVVMARELGAMEGRGPRVVVAAQPTRGVDVGAIERIHAELDGVRRARGAVLLISAELEELLGLADRIVVLYRGRIVAEFARGEATREGIGEWMTGAQSKAGSSA